MASNTGGRSGNPGNFANDLEKAREAGQLGGTRQGEDSNPGNFANDPEKAREAGQIGGSHQGRETNPGNFANDRSKAQEAGRRGGQASHGGGFATMPAEARRSPKPDDTAE
jgi:general stress protein YciG